MAQTPPENQLSSISIITSQALNHIRTSWVNADEAQDALYFHHDTLWKVRNHPHDVLGALDVIMKGEWVDLSQDICLKSDGYRDSEEGSWDVNETRERLKSTIRRKLFLGEVGMFHSIGNNNKFWWNMVLEQNGTVLRLFYGRPFVALNSNHQRKEGDHQQQQLQHHQNTSSSSTKIIYPIEARLTILSEKHPAPWTLLSIRIRTNVKTGESNHQLDLSQEQMYRFHQLCEVNMNQEENRIARLNSQNDDGGNRKDESDKSTKDVKVQIARPLEKLLDMSHMFSLSWQLEILSSQADALRKGTWSSKLDSKGITISHVHFYSEEDQFGKNNKGNSNSSSSYKTRMRPMAVMAIHFWEVDDRNGRPSIGTLTEPNKQSTATLPSKSHLPSNDKCHVKRLTLEIIAVPRVGLEVSISGGNAIMSKINDGQSNAYLNRNVEKLLSSVQDPFQLSASEALLCAAVICAENRCRAALESLLRLGKINNESIVDPLVSSHSSRSDRTTKIFKALPSWLHLSIECGSIAISANIYYHGKEDEIKRPPVLLFRLACDSRSGCFVPIFPESTSLLRHLSCNDPMASEVQLLRQAKSISLQEAPISSSSSASSNTRRIGGGRGGSELTGRVVRDTFESLTRSMDILGRRVGVGGDWDNVEHKFSPALREKSIMQACDDVRSSLMACSSIAIVYGVAAVAAAVASGVDPVPDIAGGPINMNEGNTTGTSITPSTSSVPTSITPPLAVVMDQAMREVETVNANGDKSITMRLDRYICGIASSVSHDALKLHLFDICTTIESVTEPATRSTCEELSIELGDEEDVTHNGNGSEEAPQTKRIKLENDAKVMKNVGLKSFTDEVGYLANRFKTTWDRQY